MSVVCVAVLCRWEAIANFLKIHITDSNRSAKDVLAKAKQLQKNGNSVCQLHFAFCYRYMASYRTSCSIDMALFDRIIYQPCITLSAIALVLLLADIDDSSLLSDSINLECISLGNCPTLRAIQING